MSDGVGPSLSSYLRKTLENIRTEEKYIPVAIWTVSQSGVNADDIYAVPTSISSGSGFFSGSVAWQSAFKKENTQGGWYSNAECIITAHKDNKNNVEGENKYLVVEGVSVRPSRVVDASDTNEIVIYCEKYHD